MKRRGKPLQFAAVSLFIHLKELKYFCPSMRIIKKFTIPINDQLKAKMTAWAGQFQHFCWLDGNGHAGDFEAILAVGAHRIIKASAGNALEALGHFKNVNKDWIFGFLGYGLKDELEDLSSNNHDELHFPDLCFFVPSKVFKLHKDGMEVQYLEHNAHETTSDIDEILAIVTNETQHNPLTINARLTQEEYISKVEHMLAHIKRGDIYEANFCMEFYAHGKIDPYHTFQALNSISRAPFASFLKIDDHYVMSSSPERYIKKTGNKVMTQPIKGTARRSHDVDEDLQIARELSNNLKERSENIMITDLVRNDLSKIAVRGSVKVDELCGVYTFNQVHQMISTISAHVDEDKNAIDIIKATFPMGSMTGAPKVSAMKIIEKLEVTERGLYSGAVGYFDPEGDFDFNVVIRSILYNASRAYVSFSVGSAVTALANPMDEYEECLLKARAMRQVLE